jgi:general secretion pathway protein L
MRAFFDWWFHQLASLLPTAMAGGTAAHPDAVIVEVDRSQLTLSLRQGGVTTVVDHLRADEAGLQQVAASVAKRQDRPGLLLVSVTRTCLLQKQLSLPAAAQHDLWNVLSFEIERETPFTPEEVYWTYVRRGRDATAARLDVDLILVPRAIVDPLMKALGDGGLKPLGIEVEGQDGSSAFLPLGNNSNRGNWARSQRPLMPLAAATCALAAIAVVIPFAAQEWALASTDAAIAALSTTAREAATLRQSTERLTATSTFLDKERARNGSALGTLAALTRALPDDSYLTAATLRAGKWTLTGLSPSAAQLIGELAESDELGGPAFEAPVTRSEGSDLETFTISVSLPSTGAP